MTWQAPTRTIAFVVWASSGALGRDRAPLFGRGEPGRLASWPHPRGSAPLARVLSCPGLTSRSRTPGSLEEAESWGGVLSYSGGRLGGGCTVGTRRLYLARNPPIPPHRPPPTRRRKGGRSYPGTGRQGRAVGASFSAMPGPPARGAAVASAGLGPPAAWVGGGREGVVTAVRLTPSPQLPQLEGTSYIRRSSTGGSASPFHLFLGIRPGTFFRG